jgi:glucose-1-phosphatase
MTFLFDIGRVLLDFDFETSLSRLLPADTLNPATRLAALIEKKDDFEAGRIPEPEYVQWAIERLGGDITPEAFRHAWRHIFTPNEPMWSVAGQLVADGHRLILFSNTNSIHCPWIFETYPRFSIFDGAVLSHLAGGIKPDRPIYEHAIREHGLIPEETRYIDDLPANIATGREFGFRSWQYDLNDHGAFEKWLAGELGH